MKINLRRSTLRRHRPVSAGAGSRAEGGRGGEEEEEEEKEEGLGGSGGWGREWGDC